MAAEPLWRSLLFVPAHVERFVAGAADRGADGVVLDLEDGVPAAAKEAARRGLADAAKAVGRHGADVLVRINPEPSMAVRDLSAMVMAGVRALVVPKARRGDELADVAAILDRLEHERGLPAAGIGIVAQVESVDALPHLDAVASAPRVVAMNLGTEDFSVSAGMDCVEESLLYPSQQIVFAARRAGIQPLGFAGPIADFSDGDRFRRMVRRARRLGFVGAFAVHPLQVAILNEEFAPAAAEVEWARRALAAFESAVAAGAGAARLDGRMVDAPVAARARAILHRSQAVYRRGDGNH